MQDFSWEKLCNSYMENNFVNLFSLKILDNYVQYKSLKNVFHIFNYYLQHLQ